METVNMSGSAKRTGNESPLAFEEYREDDLRKVCDVLEKANVQSQTLVKTLFEMEKKTFGLKENDELEKMKNENEKLKYLQKSEKLHSPEEILTENKLESCDKKNNARSSCSIKENTSNLQRRGSESRMCNSEVVNVKFMVEIIQKELKILTDMSPSVTDLASVFSETLSHYKECLYCGKKISSSLPEILSRTQKLVEYVTTKKHGSHLKPCDYNFLRQATNKSIFKKAEEIKNSALSEPEPDLASKKLKKQIELSEKVNATDITEGRPGVQIALKFRTKIKKKRLFEQARKRFLKNFSARASIVHLKEFETASIIQIIKPSPQPQIIWDKRTIISSPKEFHYIYRQVFAQPSVTLISITVIVPLVRIYRIERAKSYFKSTESCEERSLQTKKNLFTIFLPQGKKKSGPKTTRSFCFQKQHSNEKESFARRLQVNAVEVVKDLLKGAEEKKMQIHKMKELELEVKQLKNLILEVHKNQMELSKVVVEEGTYSQLIEKLIDPNVLEEESRTVKKLAEVTELGKKSSFENLQATVDDVKQKCTLKNRMIMTLVECLQNSVYKKWWEEIISSAFDESRSTEKFSHERITGLDHETSLTLIEGYKESKESLEGSRSENHSVEEEPNMKEIMGANFSKILPYQSEKLVKTDGCMFSSNFEEFLNYLPRMEISAFPLNTDVPEDMSSKIRKLESQISLLNAENERLWHEIHKLRELLESSMKRFPEGRLSSTSKEPMLFDKIKTSKRAINLTIQVSSKKGFRKLNDSPYVRIIENAEISREGGFSEVSQNTPVVKYSYTGSASDEKESDSEKSVQNRHLTDLSDEFKFRSKSEEGRLENDHNSEQHDSSVDFPYDSDQENEELNTFVWERSSVKEQNKSIQKFMTSTHSLNDDILQNRKPTSSKDTNPEVIAGHQPGPSQRPTDHQCTQSLSRIELTKNHSVSMFAAISNEWELHTIPEYDHPNSDCSINLSKNGSQDILCLRKRVRTIHKKVTVLKSKNDQIDEILDRMIDNAVDRDKNLTKTEVDLNNLTSGLD